jgi:YjbE family integral membrane protein
LPFGIDPSAFAAFVQVILIDLVLAGDNAVVIGMAAAGLEPAMRKKAILAGIAAATLLRIAFAGITTQLLAFTGLLFAGGLLLLWVCWKMYQELRHSSEETTGAETVSDEDLNRDGRIGNGPGRKTLGQAIMQIVVADVSMSLDNVLAVAGAAQEHIGALVFGLGLSVLMMGAAASVIAAVLNRMRWIAWVGLAIILFVAVRMIYEGADELLGHGLPAIPLLKSAGPATA